MNDWTEKEFIPERILERLRLGELSDDETQDLLDKLEARGEMHRLEALIEEDEEIRSHYPPAVMASHARERLRRRERERANEPTRPNRVPIFAFAALVVGLLAGGLLYMADAERNAPQPESGAALPAVEDPPREEEKAVKEEPWRNMFHDFLWMQSDPNTSPVFACIRGESHDVESRDISRVTTDSAKLLKFEENYGVLRMRCEGQGSAIATIYRGEELPRSISVRIGEEYEGDIPSPECSVDADAEVRVLVDRRGVADKVLVAGRVDDETSQCLRSWFQQQEWGAAEEPWRVIVWTP